MLNKGISFGLLTGIPGIFVFLVLCGLVFYAVKMRELWGRVGVGLIILGGGGNLYERVVYGGVVDNLNFLGIFYNNIWDWVIGVGLIVYLGQMYLAWIMRP